MYIWAYLRICLEASHFCLTNMLPVEPEVPWEEQHISDVGGRCLFLHCPMHHFLIYNFESVANLKSNYWLKMLISKYLKFESNTALLFIFLCLFFFCSHYYLNTSETVLLLFLFSMQSVHGMVAQQYVLFWGWEEEI